MKPDELQKLISQPESDTLEFKTNLPDIRTTERLISAFANAKGGTLIIGVKEGGEIVGIDNAKNAQDFFKRAADSILPAVAVETNVINLDGKTILVVSIEEGLEFLHRTKDGVFVQRLGSQIVPITSDTIYENVQKHATSIDDVFSEVSRLSQTIEQVNKELIAAKSWRSKISDMVLGGIIGAIISLVFALLLGKG